MNLKDIRAMLGARTKNKEPHRNARDIFEGALEAEIKESGNKRDDLGKTTTQRVCEWFDEGLHYARTNTEFDPATVPLWWATLYRQQRLLAMVAGYMYGHGVVVNDFTGEVYKA